MVQLRLQFVFLITSLILVAATHAMSETRMHPVYNFGKPHKFKRSLPELYFDQGTQEEEKSEYWHKVAQDLLTQQIETKSRLNMNVAKNILLFLGDGMSIPTVTAGRVYLGGEEKQFSFEKFPYVGLSKTYCANTQVADSACSATAYLGGVKTNYATIGVSAAVELNDCIAQNNTAYHVNSIAEWAQRNGMATGMVTTTSITHASPAGIYAHTANRNWYTDAEVIADKGNPDTCRDIAHQLIHGNVGSKLDVIMGGGRMHFFPKNNNPNHPGSRLDGKNLLAEWIIKQDNSKAYIIGTKNELLNLPKDTQKVFGLFADEHLPFHLDSNPDLVPTLEEMVTAAVTILERKSNGRGYFLFVEGGRIDHAHHDTLAMKALDETAEFDKAIKHVHARTNAEETLIVVTADHSHTMSVSGYSSRKNDIFGTSNGQLADDELPYATLSYANGPGFDKNVLKKNGLIRRKNLKLLDMKSKDYMFPSTVPLESETHGGDDVAVYANGPFAHLFTGVYEQNFIPHAMGYAACVGDRKTACSDGRMFSF